MRWGFLAVEAGVSFAVACGSGIPQTGPQNLESTATVVAGPKLSTPTPVRLEETPVTTPLPLRTPAAPTPTPADSLVSMECKSIGVSLRAPASWRVYETTEVVGQALAPSCYVTDKDASKGGLYDYGVLAQKFGVLPNGMVPNSAREYSDQALSHARVPLGGQGVLPNSSYLYTTFQNAEIPNVSSDDEERIFLTHEVAPGVTLPAAETYAIVLRSPRTDQDSFLQGVGGSILRSMTSSDLGKLFP